MSKSILDTVVQLNEIDAKSVKIVMGEVGAGKTSFHKDMPDVAGGDILYIPIGSDKGFNQLKGDPRFKSLPQAIKTIYVEKNGKKIGVKSRVIPQLIDVLTAFKEDTHNFKGLTIDAISSLQDEIEDEIKLQKGKQMDWDDWGAIKKAMFTVYELCEEIADMGYEVSLQSHFQIREYEDAYSGEKQTRLLPMMTENNAIRVLKNADAVVMIKLMPDEKDKKKVHRMTIVGGHPVIPTKIRNEYNLSFDGLLFENLTYAGLVKLMQIENIEDAADLDGVEIKEENKKPIKQRKKKPKAVKKDEEVDEAEETEDEKQVVEKPSKKKPSKKKPKKKADPEVDEEAGDEDEEIKKPAKKKPTKKKKPKVEDVSEDDDEDDDEEEIVKPPKKKPAKKKPKKKPKIEEPEEADEDENEDDDEEEVVKPKRKPARKAKQDPEPDEDEDEDEDEEDEFEDDDELEEDELFEE